MAIHNVSFFNQKPFKYIKKTLKEISVCIRHFKYSGRVSGFRVLLTQAGETNVKFIFTIS